MKYCFTDTPVEGFTHRNPEFWGISTPPADAKAVVVCGSYPEIVNYFKAQEIEVHVSDQKQEQEGDELDREAVATMDRKDVVEYLVAHGVSEEETQGVELKKLRKSLDSILFVGGDDE